MKSRHQAIPACLRAGVPCHCPAPSAPRFLSHLCSALALPPPLPAPSSPRALAQVPALSGLLLCPRSAAAAPGTCPSCLTLAVAPAAGPCAFWAPPGRRQRTDLGGRRTPAFMRHQLHTESFTNKVSWSPILQMKPLRLGSAEAQLLSTALVRSGLSLQPCWALC